MINLEGIPVASDKGARSGRTVAVLAIALMAFTAAHQAAGRDATDPLHSPECDSAQAVLERALNDAAAGSSAAKQGLAAARKQAMEACLGSQAGHSERSGAPPAPIAVPPATAAAAGALPALPPAAAAPAAPPQVQRPVAITTCDPGGCWDSEGRRLNFMGPVLIGPQGRLCTLQAGAALCPQ